MLDKLKLADEEERPILTDDVVDESIRLQGVACLIGKLLTKKKVNLSTLISTMQKLWNVVDGFKAKIVGVDLVIFQVGSVLDRNRIL